MFAVEREPLLETIDRVARAASRDEARPVLTGVLVQFAGDKLVMAATDSYRLAVKETSLGSAAAELEAIIPSRALQELARIAGDVDEIGVGVQENQVIFTAGDVWLASRRIDGQFPNIRQLLARDVRVRADDPAHRAARCRAARRRDDPARDTAPPALRRG